MSGIFLGGLANGLTGASPDQPKYSYLNEAPVEVVKALYNHGYSLDDIAEYTGLLKFEVSRKLGLDDGLPNNPTPGLGFVAPDAKSSPVTSILSEQKAPAQKSPDFSAGLPSPQPKAGSLSTDMSLDQMIEATAPQPSPGAVDWTGRELNELEAKYDQATSHYTRAAQRYFKGYI